MKPKSLDNIFKEQLGNDPKQVDIIPFDQERVWNNVQKEVKRPSISYGWVAAIAIVLLLSGYFHLQQRQIIRNQQGLIANQSRDIVLLNEKQNNILANIDTTKQVVEKKTLIYQKIESAPAIMPSYKVKVVSMMPVYVDKPVYEETLMAEKEESNIEQLNLPVYYESDELASASQPQVRNKSLTGKITKMLND
ncbi:hypothetical protein [Carboxylicivirga linearis]|uniref:Cell division protein FtsL n=1 Tax=Carboxylicivirga linearis TaxID=1628157 RepID=A0ABS5JUR3_9BACT|nr:hypothetical protein [Carboxylicivirga linearis]MBS2098650.1 hypothetical protein [Carboxylicivirga linearis]